MFSRTLHLHYPRWLTWWEAACAIVHDCVGVLPLYPLYWFRGPFLHLPWVSLRWDLLQLSSRQREPLTLTCLGVHSSPNLLPIGPPIAKDWVEGNTKAQILTSLRGKRSGAFLAIRLSLDFSWNHFIASFLPLVYFASFAPVKISPESKTR